MLRIWSPLFIFKRHPTFVKKIKNFQPNAHLQRYTLKYSQTWKVHVPTMSHCCTKFTKYTKFSSTMMSNVNRTSLSRLLVAELFPTLPINGRPRIKDLHASASSINFDGNALFRHDTNVPRLSQYNLWDGNFSLWKSVATCSSPCLKKVEDALENLDRNSQVDETQSLESHSVN